MLMTMDKKEKSLSSNKPQKGVVVDNVFMGIEDDVFRILEISDIHINHSFIPYTSIITLLMFLLDPNLLRIIHRIYIAGDFYDHGMEYTEIEKVIEIENWQKRFLTACKKYDVQVRILEGTRSHDRFQSNYFIKINTECDIGCDVKYFNKLTVDIDERYGDSTLYIPDQWNTDASETYREAVHEITKKGLQKVDIGCGHGSYKYQMQKHLRTKMELHDEVLHSELVNHAFFVGHHHNASNCHKIYCSGSPQRLRFGEEEAKGYYIATIINGKIDVQFKELVDAYPLITINCADMVAEDIMEKVHALMKKHPYELGVRIQANPNDPAAEVTRYFIDNYPHFKFKFEALNSKDKKQLPIVELKSQTSSSKSLTKLNIVDLMIKRITKKHPQFKDHVGRVLGDVLDDIIS